MLKFPRTWNEQYTWSPPKMVQDEKVTVTKMEVVEDFEMPDIQRETKYPWRELAEAGARKKTILLRFDNEDEAKKMKGSLASSGSSFYTRNEMPFSPVVKHFKKEDENGKEIWMVAVQIKDEE